MGDAVMAYFGGKSFSREQAVIDSANCASILALLSEDVISPKLRSDGFDEDFAIRIGCDFGEEVDVLWSSYGLRNISEVTATSLYVDMAAKLQQSCGRNRAVFGANWQELLDFPSELLERSSKDDDPHVTVLLPHKYKKFQLKSREYLRCTPLGPGLHPHATQVLPLAIEAFEHESKNGEFVAPYHSASRAVQKERGLRFVPRIDVSLTFPISIKCDVENHGKEAASLVNNDNHSTPYILSNERELRQFVHWESTAHRGLHYMSMWATGANQVTQHGRVGVYVT
jgi:hypothetical protein